MSVGRLGRGGGDDDPEIARGESGGLVCGALHEWFGLGPLTPPGTGSTRPDERGAHAGRRAAAADANEPLRRWVPPLGILVHLAHRALLARAMRGDAGYVVWIGRRIWPYPQSLLAIGGAAADVDDGLGAVATTTGSDLVERSVFVDPPGDAERLWAIDLALRCSAFAAVVADGAGLEMAQSRRLQLAAATGGALALVARPPEDWSTLSAASTRWWVGCRSGHGHRPQWGVTLWRCKGRQKRSDHGRAGDMSHRWTLEQDRGQGAFRLSADVVDRSRRATTSATIRTA